MFNKRKFNKELFMYRIKQVRVDNNMTMDGFGKALGVTKNAVSFWENKGVFPKPTVLYKLATQFNVSIDYLLGVSENDI